MKKRSLTRGMLCFLILALVLIAVGISGGLYFFGNFEKLAIEHESHVQLLNDTRLTALYSLFFGGLAIVGGCILLVLFLHLSRRTTLLLWEADALRQKNEAMEALIAKTQQLAHHQRLEMIGTLTSSIAHEFNNLLTPIMGYSMMALEKLPAEDEDLYDSILEIYNTSRKAKTIISRLSDLSRKNSGSTFRPVSPDDFVRRTLDVAAPAQPPKVTVQTDLNCPDQRIPANEIQLSQLLLNLILNGFQAMGDQPGTLTVRTFFDEENIFIQVCDTGCGIPENVRDQIFTPFFTTKEKGKGTGLGLAIAAQVVEDHHGRIHVHSVTGEGSTFTVTLPRSVRAE